MAKKMSTRHRSEIGYEPYMKYAKRSRTNAQQAPTSGRCGVARQASRSFPDQTASKIMNFNSGGTIQSTSRIMTTDRMMSSGVAKRFARIQPIAPRDASGGGIVSTGTSRT